MSNVRQHPEAIKVDGMPVPMAEAAIIERTLWEAQQRHYGQELRQLRDKLNRLESEVRLLATGLRRLSEPIRQPVGRTRPKVVS